MSTEITVEIAWKKIQEKKITIIDKTLKEVKKQESERKVSKV